MQISVLTEMGGSIVSLLNCFAQLFPCNARLRAAWMMVADNMLKCNAYWMKKAERWRGEGHKPQDIRARIANRMTRGVFKMVSGRQIYQHASRLDRGYVMDKLLTFHREHQTSPAVIVRDLKHAADQLPKSSQLEEGSEVVNDTRLDNVAVPMAVAVSV